MSASDRSESNRLPYMPKYVDDWLSSATVASFTLEQEGAYDRLLMWEWKDPTCTLPNDETVLAQYSRLGSRWRRLGRPIVKACFVEEGGRLVNLKLRELWRAAMEKSRQAKDAANSRWDRERQRRLNMDGGGDYSGAGS